MSDPSLEPYAKRLAIVRYAKNKFGIGFNGGPAFWFLRSDFGELDKDDELLWAHVIHAYNEKCGGNEQC
jgi:hypothetical protein